MGVCSRTDHQCTPSVSRSPHGTGIVQSMFLTAVRKLQSLLISRESVIIRSSFQLSMAATNEPSPKKSCSSVLIGTHSGTFHCDEALACYMLKLLPEYKDARIVRTRDSTSLAPCDVVVDVGGVYDPNTHRYDHHQRTFEGTMHSLTNGAKRWTTKLSSAGLVYLHFGRRVISTIAGTEVDNGVTEELYDRVYTNFVEEVDAVDNGISDRDGSPRYKITSTISNRVGRLNPAWNNTTKDPDVQFQSAMSLVGEEFEECVRGLLTVWLPARTVVQRAVDSRLEIHSSGEVIRLSEGCPWKEHLFEIEKTTNLLGNIKFVLYKEGNSDKWRVQAVPLHESGFENRLSLHPDWCGLRDEELCRISEIPGCVFVHANGFIGGNLTYEGALAMAVKTVETQSNL